MDMWIKIFREWLKWRKNWDDLCNRCGDCCYQRRVEEDGTVVVDHRFHCEYLDNKTRLCTVYQDRFKVCDHCGKVNLWVALFNPTLPNDCPYRTTFRLWEKKD